MRWFNKKVFVNRQGYTVMFPNNTPCYPPYYMIGTEPGFFLRSEDEKMYIKPNGSPEELLYDFSLSVGDTLPATYVNMPNSIYVVSIDSIQTQNGMYKVFELGGDTQASYMIEGIGSTRGLLEPMGPVLDYDADLDCYSQNDTRYYPTIEPGNCDLHVGLEEEEPGAIAVSPNPFSAVTTIEIPGSWNNVQLFVYDASGRKLRQMSGLEGPSITFGREELPSGIYFMRLTDGKKNAYQKLIVTD